MKRPNVIVVLADDMGYSDISCFGSEINTPWIDQIGKEKPQFVGNIMEIVVFEKTNINW
ncbi:MAG: hypothetical protein R3Y24_07240 [Eubacteriales bacterium]